MAEALLASKCYGFSNSGPVSTGLDIFLIGLKIN
jgi:hypothetical protein